MTLASLRWRWGIPFAKRKSELKYFESALVGVPTVASPTVPFAEAINHEVTGFLASNQQEWYETLKTLVQDTKLRHSVGAAAFFDVLWKYGPERREELASGLIDQILSGSATAAREFELELHRCQPSRVPRIESAEFDVPDALARHARWLWLFHFTYADYGIDALESVKAQTISQGN